MRAYSGRQKVHPRDRKRTNYPKTTDCVKGSIPAKNRDRRHGKAALTASEHIIPASLPNICFDAGRMHIIC